MSAPYYQDESVALYHGDCREVTEWLEADVLVTDPPYGRAWRQGKSKVAGIKSDAHPGIAGDADTSVRDTALAMWHQTIDPRLGGYETAPAIVFGDLMLQPPIGTQQVLVYRKPPNAGTRGATAGWRRDIEAIYLLGGWWSSLSARRSSVITTALPSQGNPSSPQGIYGHPHVKPLDVMEQLVSMAHPRATIADPFAGTGATLMAAKCTGRRAVGIEISEAYCETAAKRLAQHTLFGATS